MTGGERGVGEGVAADARRRGVRADASEVLISAGALQGIDLLCRVYLRPGDVVVAESPAFANPLSAFRNHGAHVLEAPVDEEGLAVKAPAPILPPKPIPPPPSLLVPPLHNP